MLRGIAVVPRADLVAGLLVPATGCAPRVTLVRKRGRPIDLEVRDEAEGRALLASLGLDATQSAATFTISSPLLAIRWVSVVACAASTAAGTALWMYHPLLGTALVAVFALACQIRGRLHVG